MTAATIGRRRSRSRRATALVVGALVAMAGCSGGDGSGRAATRTTGHRETAAEVRRFDGSVDDFYRVPDPLPRAAPGTVIRTMQLGASGGLTGVRVMYHSTDAEGDDRAATGLVYAPDGAPPDGGWPILAWAHGTSGLVSRCAPSRTPSPPPAFGVRGVLVAADYIGLGPVGEVHPYLSAAAEGHAVIDLVAAARSLPDVHAGDDWVVAGVSQGGHAALVTNEMAAERLPAAHLLGAVALAPGSELGQTFGDDLQARVIITLVMVGVAAEHPEIHLSDYLDPSALAASAVIEQSCIDDITRAMVGAATNPAYFTVDPRTTEVGKRWLADNDPGHVAARSPLLVVQGGHDIVVLPARTDALMQRLCAVGQVVHRIDVPTADHNSVTDQAKEEVGSWLRARLAGDAATSDC